MLFESTTVLLQDIVYSLENEHEIRWDDHSEIGNQCVYELHQMSRSSSGLYRTEPKSKGHAATAFDRAVRAIPHVKLMNKAVRQKDRTGAIESGRAAIAEMSGAISRASAPMVSPPDKQDRSRPLDNSERITEQQRKSRANHRAVSKAKSRRSLAVKHTSK